MVLSKHCGLWIASAPACGVQVIDRLIRASPSLWLRVLQPTDAFEERSGNLREECLDVAALAATAMASPCPNGLVEDRVHLMRKWRLQLAALKLSPGITQRTDAWHEARAQLTTASDVSAAIGGRNGSSKTFLVKKAGGPEEQTPFSGNAPPLKWGVMFEPIANHIYAKRIGVSVHEFGLLRHPSIPHIGASPDGITDMGVMLEIKCPFSRIIDGTVPAAYVAQIQCQLDVCQLDECDFFECMFELVTGSPSGDGSESGGGAECREGSQCGEGSEIDEGLESGLLVEIWDDSLKAYAYQYCFHVDSAAEQEAWAQVTMESLATEGFDPVTRRWRLKGFDLVRVHKDDSYVQTMNDGIDVAWKRVLRYREDRGAYRAEVLGLGAKHVAAPQSIKGYAFVDDE